MTRYGYSTVRIQYGAVRLQYGTVRLQYSTDTVRCGTLTVRYGALTVQYGYSTVRYAYSTVRCAYSTVWYAYSTVRLQYGTARVCTCSRLQLDTVRSQNQYFYCKSFLLRSAGAGFHRALKAPSLNELSHVFANTALFCEVQAFDIFHRADAISSVFKTCLWQSEHY